MSKKDGTNQYDRREMKRLLRHPQASRNVKYPNLVGRTVSGFEITFEDDERVEHDGGLLTLDSKLIQQHGRIKKAAPI